jgi:G3E family GTPase
MHRPHLIVLGGFLGAGKTSAVIALADWLADQGIRMACIANDQGNDLVDTVMLRACGLATEEITGGCFCCRFDALLDAASRLGAAEPDVIVAEAVGSCTDLAATVASPMRRISGHALTIAPLSVVVDAGRARVVLGLDADDVPSPEVTYLYTKQLEEADVIAVNKCELLTMMAVDELVDTLRARAPWAAIFRVSVREKSGLDRWFTELLYGAPRVRPAFDIDYARYAAGEACLGWLNASFDVAAPQSLDGNALLRAVAQGLQQRLQDRGAAVTHLKLSLASDALPAAGVAAMQLTANRAMAEASSQLDREISEGRILINLRAEATPQLLEEVVRALPAAVESIGAAWRVTLVRVDAFQPSPPVPTHRDA